MTNIRRSYDNLHKWLIFKGGNEWVLATPKLWRGEMAGFKSLLSYHPTWHEAVKAMQFPNL